MRKLKGPGRPVIGEADRAAMLAALACVALRGACSTTTRRTRCCTPFVPTCWSKAAPTRPTEVVGHEVVEAYGGTVCVTGVVDGISTTNILASLSRGETVHSAEPHRNPAPSHRHSARRASRIRRAAEHLHRSARRPEVAMKQKLTVIIPCKNERKNIRPCIESAKRVADEVLVADSGSTDGTLDIVRDVGGCRIVEREYVNSGNFKNWAIPQASAPLGADRRRRRTRDAPSWPPRSTRCWTACPTHDGYHIYRANYFLGHRIRHSGWGRDKVLRLFRRDLGRYVGESDHAEVQRRQRHASAICGHGSSTSPIGPTTSTFASSTATPCKAPRTSTPPASGPASRRCCSAPPLRFLHCYIIRLGFLDGLAGLQISALTGMSSFVKQMRLWELEHAHPAARSRESERPTRIAGAPRKPPERATGTFAAELAKEYRRDEPD